MDGLMQKAWQQSVVQKKPLDSISWKFDQPWPQPCFLWDSEGEIWQRNEPPHPINRPTGSADIDSLALYSWNIDFMLPYAEARMTAALAHLETLTGQLPPTTAIAVNLQECTPSDLHTISNSPWVRANFHMTDLDSSAWGTTLYGTTTLVDRRLALTACFRVHYAATKMERDALFVDATVPAATNASAARTLRLGNTHLESLALDPPLRLAQMRVAAAHLRAADVDTAVLAGDFNATQPFDAALHADNGLQDAFLALGGGDGGGGDGATWGHQALPALRAQFGCSRMDKAYFGGARGAKLLGFETFGADVEVDAARTRAREGLLALGFEKAWITDHLGIKATFRLVDE